MSDSQIGLLITYKEEEEEIKENGTNGVEAR